MSDNTRNYVLRKRAVPEVLLKVVEAKRTAGRGDIRDRSGGHGVVPVSAAAPSTNIKTTSSLSVKRQEADA